MYSVQCSVQCTVYSVYLVAYSKALLLPSLGAGLGQGLVSWQQRPWGFTNSVNTMGFTVCILQIIRGIPGSVRYLAKSCLVALNELLEREIGQCCVLQGVHCKL